MKTRIYVAPAVKGLTCLKAEIVLIPKKRVKSGQAVEGLKQTQCPGTNDKHCCIFLKKTYFLNCIT